LLIKWYFPYRKFQKLDRIEYMHSKEMLHRDIKPDNFLTGTKKRNDAHLIYAVDFGLAKRYTVPKTGAHIPYKENKSLTGTARYASLNTHIGIEQGRRDDLESLGYVLLYFLKGALPWQGLAAKTKKEKYDKIKAKKGQTTMDVLCKGLPVEFEKYMKYCRDLAFEERPDYKYLKGLIRKAWENEGFKLDYVFEWIIVKRNKHTLKLQDECEKMQDTSTKHNDDIVKKDEKGIVRKDVKAKPDANRFTHSRLIY